MEHRGQAARFGSAVVPLVLRQRVQSKIELVEVPSRGQHQTYLWLVGHRPIRQEINLANIPDLFLRFARSCSTRDKLLGFVRHYGIPVLDEEQLDEPGIIGPSTMDACVELGVYLRLADLMLFVVRLHAELQDGNRDYLIANRDRIANLSSHYSAICAGLADREEYVKSLYQQALGDLRFAAMTLISMVCTAFTGMVDEPGVHTLVSYYPGLGARRYRLAPTFTTIVFDQFVQFMECGKGIGICEECRQPFEKTRRDRIYCSDNCSARKRNRKAS